MPTPFLFYFLVASISSEAFCFCDASTCSLCPLGVEQVTDTTYSFPTVGDPDLTIYIKTSAELEFQMSDTISDITITGDSSNSHKVKIKFGTYDSTQKSLSLTDVDVFAEFEHLTTDLTQLNSFQAITVTNSLNLIAKLESLIFTDSAVTINNLCTIQITPTTKLIFSQNQPSPISIHSTISSQFNDKIEINLQHPATITFDQMTSDTQISLVNPATTDISTTINCETNANFDIELVGLFHIYTQIGNMRNIRFNFQNPTTSNLHLESTAPITQIDFTTQTTAAISGINIDLSGATIRIYLPTSNGRVEIIGTTPNSPLILVSKDSPFYIDCHIGSLISFEKDTAISNLLVFYESDDVSYLSPSTDPDITLIWVSNKGVCIYENIQDCDSVDYSKMTIDQFSQCNIQSLSTDYQIDIKSRTNDIISIPISLIDKAVKVNGLSSGDSNVVKFTGSNTASTLFSIECVDSTLEFDSNSVYLESLSLSGTSSIVGSHSPIISKFSSSISSISTSVSLTIKEKATLVVPSDFTRIECESGQVHFRDSTQDIIINTIRDLQFTLQYKGEPHITFKSDNADQLSFTFESIEGKPFEFTFDGISSGISTFVIISDELLTINNPPSTIKLNENSLTLYEYPITISTTSNVDIQFSGLHENSYLFTDCFLEEHTIRFSESGNYNIHRRIECTNPHYIFTSLPNTNTRFSLTSESSTKSDVCYESEGTFELTLSDYKLITLQLHALSILKILNVAPYYQTISISASNTAHLDSTEVSFPNKLIIQNPFSLTTALTVNEFTNSQLIIEAIVTDSKIDFSSINSFTASNIELTSTQTSDTVYIITKQTDTSFTHDNTQISIVAFNINQVCLEDISSTQCPTTIGSIIHSIDDFSNCLPIHSIDQSFKLINYFSNNEEINIHTSLLESNHRLTIEGSPQSTINVNLDGELIDLSIQHSLVKFTRSNDKGSINILEIDKQTQPLSDTPISIKVNRATLYESSLSANVRYNIQTSLKLELNQNRAIEIGVNQLCFSGSTISFDPLSTISLTSKNDITVSQNSQLTQNDQIGHIEIQCLNPLSVSFLIWPTNVIGERSIVISTPNFNVNTGIFTDIISQSIEFRTNSPVPVSFREGSAIKTSVQSIVNQQQVVPVGHTGYITIYDSTTPTINIIRLKEKQLVINQKSFDVSINTGYIILQTEIPKKSLIFQNPDISPHTGSLISFGLLLCYTTSSLATFDLENWLYFLKNDKICIQTNSREITQLHLYVSNNKDADNFDTSKIHEVVVFNIHKCCICKDNCLTDSKCGESFDGSILSTPAIFLATPKIASNFTLINAITQNDVSFIIQAGSFTELHVYSIENAITISMDITPMYENQKLYFYGASLEVYGGLQETPIDTFQFTDNSKWKTSSQQNSAITARNIVVDAPSIGPTFILNATESLTVKKADQFDRIQLHKNSFEAPNITPIRITGRCVIEFDELFETELNLLNDLVETNPPSSGNIGFPQLSLNMKKSGQLTVQQPNDFQINSIQFQSIDYVTLVTTKNIPFEFLELTKVKMTFTTLRALQQPNFIGEGTLYIINSRDIQGVTLDNGHVELYNSNNQRSFLLYTLVHIEIENSRSEYTPFEISFSQQNYQPITIIGTIQYSRILPLTTINPNIITLETASPNYDIMINSNVQNIDNRFIKGENVRNLIVFNLDSNCLCSDTDVSMCKTENKCGLGYTGSIFNSINVWNNAIKANMNKNFTLMICFTQENAIPQFRYRGLTQGSNLTIRSNQLNSQIDLYIEKFNTIDKNDDRCQIYLENVNVNIKLCQETTLYLNSLECWHSSISQNEQTDLTLISMNELRYDDYSKLTSDIQYSVDDYVYIQVLKDSGVYKFYEKTFEDILSTTINIISTTLIDFNVISNSLQLYHSIDASQYNINLNMNNAKSLVMDGAWGKFQNVINVESASSLIDVKISQNNNPIKFKGEVHPRMSFDSLCYLRSKIALSENSTLTVSSLPSRSVISIADSSVYIANPLSDSLTETFQFDKEILLGQLYIENENAYPTYLTVHYGYEDSYPSESSNANVIFVASINEAAFLLDTNDWTFQTYRNDVATFVKDKSTENVKRIVFINNNEQIDKKFVIENGLIPTYYPDPNLLQPTKAANNTTKAIIIGLSVGLAALILMTLVVILVMVLVKKSEKHQIVAENSELEEEVLTA